MSFWQMLKGWFIKDAVDAVKSNKATEEQIKRNDEIQHWTNEEAFYSVCEEYNEYAETISTVYSKLCEKLIDDIDFVKSSIVYMKALLAYPIYAVIKNQAGSLYGDQKRFVEFRFKNSNECQYSAYTIISAGKGTINECERTIEKDLILENGIIGSMWKKLFEIQAEGKISIKQFLTVMVDSIIGCIKVFSSMDGIGVNEADYICSSIKNTFLTGLCKENI